MTTASECKKETPKSTKKTTHGEAQLYAGMGSTVMLNIKPIAGEGKRLIELAVIDSETQRYRTINLNEVDGEVKGAAVRLTRDGIEEQKLTAEIQAAVRAVVDCGNYDPAAKLVNAMAKPVEPEARAK